MLTTAHGAEPTTSTLTSYAFEATQTSRNTPAQYSEWLFKDEQTCGPIQTFLSAFGLIVATTGPNGEPVFSTGHVSTKATSVMQKLESQFFSRLIMPSHWRDEGVSAPNISCKQKAFELCRHIFNVYERLPDRVAASKEGGIFVAFDSGEGDKTMVVEVYNDLETSYLVNDNARKTVLAAGAASVEALGQAIRYVND